jgi:hypothetical protein
MKKLILLILNAVYFSIALANDTVEESKVKNSDFLQYKLQCTINVPIELAVTEAWKAIVDLNFVAPNEKKTILVEKEKEVVMHTYIPILAFEDRQVITCGKWDHRENFENDIMSWQVCERHDAPLKPDAIKILKSNGSWLFHSNNNGTTITITSHTDPSGNLPALMVNMKAGDRLIDDCQRLRKFISRKAS